MGRLELLVKRKSVYAAAGLLVICYSAYCLYDFIGMAHRSSTRNVMQELITIAAASEKSPPGMARAEQFLRRLKAVDTRSAPPEVKAALQDYIAAFEGGIEARKSGRDFAQYDLACAEAKQRLAGCFEKYKL